MISPAVETSIEALKLPDIGQFLERRPVDYAKSEWPYQMVSSPGQLLRLAEKLGEASAFNPAVPKYPLIGLDTETTGDQREDGRMTDLSKHLCYVQIAVPEFKEVETVEQCGPAGARRSFTLRHYALDIDRPGMVYVINVLELTGRHLRENPRSAKGIWSPEDNPLLALKQVLEDSRIVKATMHGLFEVGQFRKYGIKLTGIEDVEVMSRWLRNDTIVESPLKGDIEDRLGEPKIQGLRSRNFAALNLEIGGRHIEKESQTSDWSKPITEKQLQYMIADPRFNVLCWYEIKLWQMRARREEAEEIKSRAAAVKQTAAAIPQPEKKESARKQLLAAYVERISALYRHRDRLLDEKGLTSQVRFLALAEDQALKALATVVLPREYDAALARFKTAGTEPPAGYTYEVSTRFGSATYGPDPERGIDWSVLYNVGTDLLQSVDLGLTKKALEKTLKNSGSKAEDYQVKNGRTEPKLRLEIPDTLVPAGLTIPLKQALEARINFSEKSSDELMAAAVAFRSARLEALREAGIANELGFLNARIRSLRATLLSKLLPLAKRDDAQQPVDYEFTCASGRASFATKEKSEFDLARLIKEQPQALKGAINPEIAASRLDELLESLGYAPAEREYLRERVLPRTGFSEKKYARSFPNYPGFYKGFTAESVED